MQKQLIRVIYPSNQGRIALRTEADWDANIEPNSVRQHGCLSEFQIDTERPYFYFKPVLLTDGATTWAREENYLARILTQGSLGY